MLARAARYARAGAAGAAPRPAPRPIFDPKAGTSPLRQLLAHRGAPELTALQKLTGAAGVVTAAGVGYVGWERAKVFAFQCLPESGRTRTYACAWTVIYRGRSWICTIRWTRRTLMR